MTRTDIINKFIEKYKFESYLEIGVQTGVNFRAVKCKKKVGVDPDQRSSATVHKTSDEFFLDNEQRFDLIFIDGLHEYLQVRRDIGNAFDCLSDGGVIVCHDMLPLDENMAAEEIHGGVWCGTCYKAFMYYRRFSNLEMYTVDTDYGCGVIKKGESEPKIYKDFSFEFFDKNRKEVMNIISVEEFIKKEF